MARRPAPRRGVLLLIVLSLLVLFLLIGLSFIVSAGQFERSLDSEARSQRTGMPGAKLADEALYQVLRGTTNPYSVVGPHSLLEDLYGRDYLISQQTSSAGTSDANQTQVFRFQTNGSSVRFDSALRDSIPGDDYYGGCVLTFIDGNARGISTRILRYQPSTRFITIQGVAVQNPISGLPEPPVRGSRFIINGRPFNGVGAGFNTRTGDLDDALIPTIPVAYAPNYSAYRNVKSLEEITYGGLDESWDAVDSQNMFLAKAGIAAINTDLANDASLDESDPNYMDPMFRQYLMRTGGNTPSFHRPYMLAYLQRRNSGADILNTPDLRRTLILRPDRADHPAFTGTNPNFDPVSGPWDVDNDADGIPDSIWVDFGLSVLTGPDGRLYKPLVAPLIIDLDGRINLNASDSVEHAKIRSTLSSFRPRNGVSFFGPGTEAANTFALGTTTNPFGMGFGTADITVPLPTGVIRSRYVGQNTSGEKYSSMPDTTPQLGEPATPGAGPIQGDGLGDNSMSDEDLTLRRRGMVSNAFVPGTYAWNDQLQQALQSPWTSGIQGSLQTGYGSPADLHARGIPFLDPTGNLLWSNVGIFDGLDDPYETNPLIRGAEDSLYSLADLEFLLRYDASEARAKSRLGSRSGDEAFGGIFFTSLNELTTRTYTTHSVHIPAPPTVQSVRLSAEQPYVLVRSLREMIVAKLQQSGYTGDLNVVNNRLIPPELARGEKLNLNQLLQANPVQNTPELHWELLNKKAEFARHLYHLMMLVTDSSSFVMPTENAVDLLTAQRLHARRIAQWAINVVDFGDADSVMTPFAYDERPFDSTFVPIDELFDPRLPSTSPDRQIIWGVEHPELVLTETLAFHDRLVQDTDDDNGSGKRRADSEPDPNLDQSMPPRGPLFVELLCVRGDLPRVPDNPRAVAGKQPEDLYSPGVQIRPNENQFVLQLDKFVPNTLENGGDPSLLSKPVWRLAISKAHSDSKQRQSIEAARVENPDIATFTPDDLGDLGGSNNVERFVWLSRVGPTLTQGNEERPRNTYFNQSTVPTPTVVRPGDHVVIAPQLINPIGMKSPTNPQDQEINLATMNHKHADGSARVMPGVVVPIIARTDGNFDGSGAPLPSAGVSISEPTAHRGYYPELKPGETFYTDAAGNPKPLDEPLDSRIAPSVTDTDGLAVPREEVRPLADDLAGTETGTRQNQRTIFLQRLADPNRPWHPLQNPYRTVDWMPVDLTVFNSLEDPQDDLPDGPFDRDDDPSAPVVDAADENDPVRFASREKDDRTTLDRPRRDRGNSERFNVFSNVTFNSLNVTRTRNQTPMLDLDWRNVTQNLLEAEGDKDTFNPSSDDVPHTLGWVNRYFFARDLTDLPRGSTYVVDGGIRMTGQYAGTPFGTEPHVATLPAHPADVPIPSNSLPTIVSTYPSLVWHNRPYANIFELMLVPACSQSRLTQEYGTSRWQDPVTADNSIATYRGAFGHLLNFFHSSTNVPGANYHRIFDFVRVPSRFRGTQTSYHDLARNNPLYITPLVNTNGDAQLDNNDVIMSYSNFREPGIINLSTSFVDTVWNSVGFDSVIAPDIYFHRREFEKAMAGGIPKNERYPNGLYPAEYPFPLRSSNTANLSPPLVAIDGSTVPKRPGVDSTLLRSDTPLNPIAGYFPQPLLAEFALQVKDPDPSDGSPATSVPISEMRPFGQAIQNRKSNAYFRYKDIIKAGGSVSGQSNVFAAWITVGFFEVEPNFGPDGEAYFVDSTHPDGYRYGAELGSDIGNVTRHRAFYILDRSIPVAFEPGVNHNVDHAILMRRHLE